MADYLLEELRRLKTEKKIKNNIQKRLFGSRRDTAKKEVNSSIKLFFTTRSM
jgi:hypothetical protein